MKARILLFTILFLSLGLVLYGQGTIIRQHLGATDPVSEGFSLSLASGSAVGPVVGDLGRDSWSVISGGGPAGYFLSLTAGEQAAAAGQDLALFATLRIVRSPNVELVLYTLPQQYAVQLDSQPDGDPIVYGQSSLNPLFVFEGGGPGYHEYGLFYRAATGQVALWLDGVERVSSIPGISVSTGWGGFWGAFQGSASEANWNRVTFEIIPEPSALVLLGCGGVLLAGHWLRRFRRRK